MFCSHRSTPEGQRARARYKSITSGLLMLAAGTGLFLYSAGHIDPWSLQPWWPVLFLLPAGEELVGEGFTLRGVLGAAFWIAVAGLLLLFMQGYPVFQPRTIFAIGLIVFGLRLLWRPSHLERGGA